MEEGEVPVLVAGPGRSHITINTLPDEVLLGIFDLCVNSHFLKKWETLVHVCRRWRSIVFASPHRLNLRLLCTARTRMEDMLDIWPTLPISLRVYYLHDLNEDNAIATLEYNDRICQIHVQGSDNNSFERFAASMQVPFPSLTDLSLATATYRPLPPVPDSFLGGSAPCLRSLYLYGIAVLGLPNLLLSATSLIRLRLDKIPLSGYISPYVMADCLSSLVRLEELRIAFTLQPHSHQTSLRSPPLTRTILPKLIYLSFRGTSEYLEVLFAWIDGSLHDLILIEFFNPVNFDISQISLFFGREELIIEQFDQASMHFNRGLIEVTLLSRKGATSGTLLRLLVKCGDIGWRLQSLSQSRSRIPPPLDPSYDRFDYTDFASGCSPPWTRDMEQARWLEFLHSSFFADVQTLYLSEGFVLCIAPILRDLAAREDGAVKALPALKSLFVDDLRPSTRRLILETIGEFIVAREFAGHPVVFNDGNKKVVFDSRSHGH